METSHHSFNEDFVEGSILIEKQCLKNGLAGHKSQFLLSEDSVMLDELQYNNKIIEFLLRGVISQSPQRATKRPFNDFSIRCYCIAWPFNLSSGVKLEPKSGTLDRQRIYSGSDSGKLGQMELGTGID